MDIQEGVYFRPGERPRGHFLITFLSVDEGGRADDVGEALTLLWARLRALKRGETNDLPGHPVPSGNLDCLIGYGPKAFKLTGAPTSLPGELGPASRFLSPRTTGGGPILVGSGVDYAADTVKNVATEEIALQFTADSALAVRRAYVETWKELRAQGGPVRIGTFFDGFQRDDGRSWLSFHDGLSNLISGPERHEAIRIKSGPFIEGTTFAFLRLEVDLDTWQTINASSQEALVGRSKLTGCPLVAVDAAGDLVADATCPAHGTNEVGEQGNETFREPPLGVPQVIKRSHVHRSNFSHSQATGDPGSLRIFRQGYEFLEARTSSPGFRAGLNFVSFQDTPRRVLSILTRSGWLGNTNFGAGLGTPQDKGPLLLSCRAAGVYLAPPVGDPDVLPGGEIFGL
ncbi:MAG: peroxidase [Thermoanaerobaculia bacterium]|nr:MAG: peroxidase [Thermoanaerobaculia bacterium]MBZ0101157.1 Dyp-type peroxidase [Thermoanaerobaculia bacterium]